MKKFLSILCAAITCLGLCFGVAACNKNETGYKVYAPDGAPALSLAKLCVEDDSQFDINVVKAETITAFVSGEEAAADFAIMPVNAAVKLLGNGQKYQMLGTVTHGNLFLLKKRGGEDISVENLSLLKGKTVGVINLANVPGLMFKVILKEYGIEYNQLTDGAGVASVKVNLKAIAATEAIPSNAQCDYFVVPEPAATTKVNATGGALSVAASLQTLYGGTNGYPQAVAVAKKSVIENDSKAVESFISALSENENWLKSETTSSQSIVEVIQSKMPTDTSPTFTAANLNKTVIANCGINFVANSVGKADVLDIIGKLNAVQSNLNLTASDEFFYGI